MRCPVCGAVQLAGTFQDQPFSSKEQSASTLLWANVCCPTCAEWIQVNSETERAAQYMGAYSKCGQLSRR